jgi:hypothetical protein
LGIRIFTPECPRKKKNRPPSAKKDHQSFIGNTVLLISGSSKPRKYYLSYTFRQPKPPSIAGSKKIIAGTNVQTYHPPILLSDLPWFSAFLKSQLNFSFGLRKIDDEFMVEITKALHASK